jgi:uncharacterized protein YndB with AHSA1/START domain
MKNSFTIRQRIKAPLEMVYAAWADLKIARTWSCPEGCEILLFDADLHVGGSYRMTMKTPGSEMSAYGKYREILPNRKIVYSWIWDTPDTEENLVTVEFSDRGPESEIVLTVSGFTAPDEVESNQEGWASSLGRLARKFE